MTPQLVVVARREQGAITRDETRRKGIWNFDVEVETGDWRLETGRDSDADTTYLGGED